MLRVGLMGLGVWGQRLLKKLFELSEFELLAAFDPRPVEIPISIPVCRQEGEFWSYPFDAVVVAAPPDVQGGLGLAVLKRGLPLFIEKPMAVSLVQAEEIVRTSRENGLVVHVDHLVRYDSLHALALERWSNGALGEVVGSLHVRLGARPRPGIAPHSILLPHDLSLAHAGSGDGGDWEARFGLGGCLLARRSGGLGTRVLLLCGAAGPRRRQTLYLGSQQSALVDEGKNLRIYPALLGPELLKTLEGPLESRTFEALFSYLADVPMLEEHPAQGDPLRASLVAFAMAVRTGVPTVCDAMDGARVTRALTAIEAALGREPRL